ATVAGSGKVDHFLEADGVEIIVAVGLQILAAADTGIGLNGATAARFISGGTVAVAASAGTFVIVKAVVAAILMAHFVGNIVNIERVANWVGEAGHAARL